MTVPLRAPSRPAPTIEERIIAWELAYRAVMETIEQRDMTEEAAVVAAVAAAARLAVGTRERD